MLGCGTHPVGVEAHAGDGSYSLPHETLVIPNRAETVARGIDDGDPLIHRTTETNTNTKTRGVSDNKE